MSAIDVARSRRKTPGCENVVHLTRFVATLAAFTVEGVTAQAVVGRLSAAGINVSLTPASYSRLGLERRGLDAVVRGSVHYTNTDEELKRLVDVVAGVGSSGA